MAGQVRVPEMTYWPDHHRDSIVSTPSSDASEIPSSPSSASLALERQQSSTCRHSRCHSNPFSQRRVLDVEKAVSAAHVFPQSTTASRGGPFARTDGAMTVPYDEELQARNQRQLLEEKALGILIYLSTLAPVVSILVAVWTITATALVILASPIRLLKPSRTAFSAQLTACLAPALKTQLKAVRSSRTAHSFLTGWLLTVLLLGPFVSLGVAVASWTAAFFWLFSALVGDPGGGQDGHNDGKATVLGVRAFWEGWLCRVLECR